MSNTGSVSRQVMLEALTNYAKGHDLRIAYRDMWDEYLSQMYVKQNLILRLLRRPRKSYLQECKEGAGVFHDHLEYARFKGYMSTITYACVCKDWDEYRVYESIMNIVKVSDTINLDDKGCLFLDEWKDRVTLVGFNYIKTPDDVISDKYCKIIQEMIDND